MALGYDLQMKTLKYYIAFKRIKNFACVEIHPQSSELLIYVKVDPKTVAERTTQDDCLRDVRSIGHYGTGDLEIRLHTEEDFERTKDLILKSYEIS